MIIYQGSSEKFIDDVRENKITDIMADSFEQNFGRKVSLSEHSSWGNSSQYIKNLLELGKLCDVFVCLEYPVPYSGERIDCLIFGKSKENKSYVVLIELKQWTNVKELEVEGNFVETFIGGGTRIVPHPSQQVEGYSNHLINFLEVFEVDSELNLFGCSYCHNYNKEYDKGLFGKTYQDLLIKYPVYSKNDIFELANRLQILLNNGRGFEIFNRFMQSPVKPSKKLLENAANIIKSEKVFSLLNEQILAKNVIFSKVRKAEKSDIEKNVILVKGGPGTGKTVIALNVVAELAKRNKKIFFGCKSKPLLEAIREKLGKNGGLLFTNLNSFIPAKRKENDLDVLIIDEAHRIGRTSNFQFSPREHRTDMPQIDQLIRCSKTSVFFIDDHQIIRNLEIGNSDIIKEAALKYGAKIEEIELKSQFRCNGSDNYLIWLESVLGHSKHHIRLRKQDNYDFKIFSSPSKLYEEIVKKDSIKKNSARLVAGFCWEWSKTLDQNGNLQKDIKIENFEMPWETHDKVTPPEGFVKWYEWAYKPEGIKQVGCIYTAQGFEFDYVGVIIGPDVKYDKVNDCLTTDISKTKDPVLKRDKVNFDRYVKNIYRVLLSRGMKGCYVYFCDKDVEKYFKERISSDYPVDFR